MKQIYGLIGYPVKHSLSPIIHNNLFRELGINAEYRLFELPPERLEDFLRKDIIIKDTGGREFSSQEIVGFNVTIPHKVRALKFSHRQDMNVVLAGAINTIKRENGELSCRNTDAQGFVDDLTKDLSFSPDGKNIFIIGCGGAGRAVIAGLMPQSGFRVKKLYISDLNNTARDSVKEHFSSLSVSSMLERSMPP